MRHNEVNGKDYHFINSEQFLNLKSKNYFFEVTTYNNNYYGSPQSCLDNLCKGQSYVAITDRAGVISYKERSDQVIPIWICPPSIEILHQRLQQRGTENNENLQKRYQLGAQEYHEEINNPLCSYHITNNDIQTATEELISIIRTCLMKVNKISP